MARLERYCNELAAPATNNRRRDATRLAVDGGEGTDRRALRSSKSVSLAAPPTNERVRFESGAKITLKDADPTAMSSPTRRVTLFAEPEQTHQQRKLARNKSQIVRC